MHYYSALLGYYCWRRCHMPAVSDMATANGLATVQSNRNNHNDHNLI